MHTILMLNQKGGVGKTTIADELAFALERRGRTVAFVTTDPQGGSVHRSATTRTRPRRATTRSLTPPGRSGTAWPTGAARRT